ncbi:MAG: HutD-family protein [Fluviicola sp.]|jgi:environmental stress-induced protein Ves|uniref:HutD family protein n=1 Tax=Fluviicola sp. TaxID=1917219 RepID=UPI00261281A8|nr:HutD family protein [Fluviicola sp.]MDF3028834.1 HutD-family protein [Fluviicola sp.]
MKIVTEADFLVSNWSGGKTTQLFIFPEGTTLSGRDFDWRISSAVIETEESDFTSFEGYERILIPLEGKLEMEHQTPNGIIQQNVNQFELARFSGSWPTKGKGKLTDFNLIFKSSYHPKVQISYYMEKTRMDLEEMTSVLFLISGSLMINNQHIHSPALVFNCEHQEAEIIYFAESRVILVEMSLVG